MIAAAAKSMKFDNFMSSPSDPWYLCAEQGSKSTRGFSWILVVSKTPHCTQHLLLVWQSSVWRILHLSSCSAREGGVCQSGGIRSHLVTLAENAYQAVGQSTRSWSEKRQSALCSREALGKHAIYNWKGCQVWWGFFCLFCLFCWLLVVVVLLTSAEM